MRAWTVHLPPAGSATQPVLIAERFTWLAALFGLPWLLANRIWWAAGGLVGIGLLLGALLPSGPALAAGAAVQILLGCHAQDLRRAALAMRGWTLHGVVLARDEDGAIARLLAAQPRLAAPWGRAALG
jgi:hypothetical protein